jgi:hypothetical protein
MKKIVIQQFDWALRRYEDQIGDFLGRPDYPHINDDSMPYISFDADEFLKNRGDNFIKIAIVSASYPGQYCVLPDQNLSVFDLIINIDCEAMVVDNYFEVLTQKWSNPNIIVLNGCALESFESQGRALTVPWFFINTQLANQRLGLNFFRKSVTKPKLFDALLGINKPHRKFIFDSLKDSNLLDKSWVSLSAAVRFDQHPKLNYYKSPGLQELEMPLVEPAMNSIDQGFDSYIPILGLKNLYYSASNLIPCKIYDTSYYSIVAETGTEHCFFTEKTAKPLLAHRLFVLFGAHRQLEKLRRFGFETFDSVIDESYDLEPNTRKRHQMAFEQVVALSKNDPEKVLKKIDDVLTHNQNLINNREYFMAPARQWVWKHIKKFY